MPGASQEHPYQRHSTGLHANGTAKNTKKTPAKKSNSNTKKPLTKKTPAKKATSKKTPAKKTPKSVTKPAAHRAALTKVQKEALDQLPHFLEVLQGVVALTGYQHPEVTHPALLILNHHCVLDGSKPESRVVEQNLTVPSLVALTPLCSESQVTEVTEDEAEPEENVEKMDVDEEAKAPAGEEEEIKETEESKGSKDTKETEENPKVVDGLKEATKEAEPVPEGSVPAAKAVEHASKEGDNTIALSVQPTTIAC